MYTLEEIRRGIRRPREAVTEINALYNRLTKGVDYNPEGIDVFSEDWDILIILDACRYDMFEDVADLSGRLERRVSRGGGTVEFLRGNVRDRTLYDTVYVTANPQYYHHQDELNTEFHDVWNLWQREWDDDLHTVHPESVLHAAREAAEIYPHKRLVIHYNQPHTPYIGSYGKELGIGSLGKDLPFLESLRMDLFHNGVSREEYRRAYRENLELVLPYVEPLLDECTGKTVVTSDHGEMLGERVAPIPIRYYSHRIGVHVSELVHVPWLVQETGERREITIGSENRERSAEGTAKWHEEEASDSVVEERLRDLGYAE